MQFARSQFVATAVLCCAFHFGSAYSQDDRIFEIGGGFAVSGTNQKPISHGHAYLLPGRPGFIFGGVQTPDGQWKLNYLFLIKHNSTSDTEFEHRNPDPTISNSSSDGITRFLRFNDRLRFGQAISEFSYEADYHVASDRLIKEGIILMGKHADLKDGRVFMVDMTADPVTMQQVNVELPDAKDIDFLNSSREEYAVFTERWLAEVVKSSEIVASTFER
jgi:hypothetical protein